ncbi:tyrosine-type recombinase/integrase [Micromonospora tulbaghiae]|uniref:tyrosine-type recombinase/integrase n=1 Tax=Micromonospora tulbaghiae TaxID=479978 RepID=UPI00331ED589
MSTTTTESRDRRIFEDFDSGRKTVRELSDEHGVTEGRITQIVYKQRAARDGTPSARPRPIAPAQRAVAVFDMGADVPVPQHIRDAYVSPEALELVRKGMSENTWMAYRKQLLIFGDWCSREGRTAAPVTEATMLMYLNYLRNLPMPGTASRRDEDGARRYFRPAPSTVWIWYSAVRFIHKIGTPPLPWECGEKLSLAIDGYTNEMRELGWRPRSAPRAYPDDVRRMVDKTERDTSTGKRDAAILLCGWHTAARAADLASYRIRDVTRTPKGLDFLLTASKTLKAGETRTTAVFRNEQHPEYDPVLAYLEWLEWLGSQRENDPRWAVFRPLDRYGVRLRASSQGPKYTMASTSISDVVTKYALLAGLDETYTMHSLRRGYATFLREQGVDPLAIARAYGWKPGGSINVYLEEANRWSDAAPGMAGFL